MKKILGMGNALVDIMTQLDHDDYLLQFELPKGSMILVDALKSRAVYDGTRHLNQTVRSGGSAANTIHGIARMGLETGFVGKIGSDEMGKIFHDDLTASNIRPHLFNSSTESGRAMALISHDAERTFATYLGAAVELSAEDLHIDLFQGYDILHIEGYLVQNHALLQRAVELAKQNGMQVSLDTASYNVVAENKDFLEYIIREFVDIVFANEDEARSLTGLEPAEALDKLADMCEIAVVKVGKEGSLVGSQRSAVGGQRSAVGGRRYEIGVIPVKSIDTTGAGDLYASGFLYGMVKGYDLEKCGKIGAILAGKVIEVIGPKLDAEGWKAVKGMIGGNFS